MTWQRVTWTLTGVAVAGAVAYLARGDVACGDLPDGCPDDTWLLMDAWARRGLVTALLASVAAAVSLLHPEHRGRRLGLALLTLGLAGAAVVNVLADHGDLPEPPAGPCDDTRDGTGAQAADKCGGWDPHWTDLFALPALAALAGLGILVGKALRRAVSLRKAPP